jgi:hypothetical protein
MSPATTGTLTQRVNEHDVLLTQLGTIVTELHENAKEDRREAKEDREEMKKMQIAITQLLEREANRQKQEDKHDTARLDWRSSVRNLFFSIGGGLVVFGLEHWLHF